MFLVCLFVSLSWTWMNDGPAMVQVTAKDEPGEVLIVTGTVYQSDRETPIAGVVLDFYHTDAKGLYRRPGTDDPEHRITATVTTDEQGRYAFRTIRPAQYPDGGPPAHIHFSIKAPGNSARSFTLFFEDDSRITERMRGEKDFGTRFGRVVPINQDSEGTWHATKDFTL